MFKIQKKYIVFIIMAMCVGAFFLQDSKNSHILAKKSDVLDVEEQTKNIEIVKYNPNDNLMSYKQGTKLYDLYSHKLSEFFPDSKGEFETNEEYQSRLKNEYTKFMKENGLLGEFVFVPRVVMEYNAEKEEWNIDLLSEYEYKERPYYIISFEKGFDTKDVKFNIKMERSKASQLKKDKIKAVVLFSLPEDLDMKQYKLQVEKNLRMDVAIFCLGNSGNSAATRSTSTTFFGRNTCAFSVPDYQYYKECNDYREFGWTSFMYDIRRECTAKLVLGEDVMQIIDIKAKVNKIVIFNDETKEILVEK